MLTKQQRYSFKAGVPKKAISHPFFVLRYEKTEVFSCGIVVSKKIEQHSVDRNKIKRQYKRVIAQLLEEHQMSYSFVFYVRKKSSDVSDEVLYKNLEQILKKEGIISQ